MQNHKIVGFVVALVLVSGITSQFMINHVFGQNEKQSTPRFEYEQEIKKSQPKTPTNEKPTKLEIKKKIKTESKYAEEIANVKTSFQLKQEAKKLEAKKQAQIEKDKTRFEYEQEIKKSQPKTPTNEKPTKLEIKKKIKTESKYAEEIANVKTSFQLKQEAKKGQR